MIELRAFTPSEAARISGVNVALQRDWRRRGYLPKLEGPSEFDAFEVASMLCMELLTQRGIGPAVSKPFAGLLGAALVKSAVRVRTEHAGPLKAIAGPIDRLAVTDPDALVLIQESAAADNAYWTWYGRALAVETEIFASRDDAERKVQRMFCWWADGTTEFIDSLIFLLESVETGDRRLSGPVIMLDFDAIAVLFVDRCKGPFATYRESGERAECAEVPQ